MTSPLPGTASQANLPTVVSSQNLAVVTQKELARIITNQLATRSAAQGRPSHITPNQILSVLKTVGQFITLSFKQGSPSHKILADICVLGAAVRYAIPNPQTDFFPSQTLGAEIKFHKPTPKFDVRTELSLARLSQITQINCESLSSILNAICRVIGSCVGPSNGSSDFNLANKSVHLEMNLWNDSLLVFRPGWCGFVEKAKLMDGARQSLPQNEIPIKSVPRFTSPMKGVCSQSNLWKTAGHSLQQTPRHTRDSKADVMSLASSSSQQRAIRIQEPAKQVQSMQQIEKVRTSRVALDSSQEHYQTTPRGQDQDALSAFLSQAVEPPQQSPIRLDPLTHTKITSTSSRRHQAGKTSVRKPKKVDSLSPIPDRINILSSPRQILSTTNSLEVPKQAQTLYSARQAQTLYSASITPRKHVVPPILIGKINDQKMEIDSLRKLSLKERLQLTKMQSANPNVSHLAVPLATSLGLFSPPQTNMNPEVDHLLQSLPGQTHLPAGSSNLSQDTFQVLKHSNLMRMNFQQGNVKVEKDLDQYLRTQQVNRRNLSNNIADLRQFNIDTSVQKKKIQMENAKFWRMQMHQRDEMASIEKKELQKFKPEPVWNLMTKARFEREAQDAKHKITSWNTDLRNQIITDRQKQLSSQENNMAHERAIVQQDNLQHDYEKDMQSFRRQAFSKDLKETWSRQISYRDNLEAVDNLY